MVVVDLRGQRGTNEMSRTISSSVPTDMGVPRSSSTFVRSSASLFSVTCGRRRSWFATNSCDSVSCEERGQGADLLEQQVILDAFELEQTELAARVGRGSRQLVRGRVALLALLASDPRRRERRLVLLLRRIALLAAPGRSTWAAWTRLLIAHDGRSAEELRRHVSNVRELAVVRGAPSPSGGEVDRPRCSDGRLSKQRPSQHRSRVVDGRSRDARRGRASSGLRTYAVDAFATCTDMPRAERVSSIARHTAVSS